jgi:quercetin dioxygenase-like cupin family protein
MTLYRITLEPGTPIPAHEHYGSVTWYVDSGELTVTVTSGQAWVRCAGCVPGATQDASGFALVPEGTEVVLESGDWMIQHDTTVHAYSNSGDSDVVIDASTTYSLEESNSTPSASPPLPGTPVAGPPIHRRGCQGGCM